MSEEDDKAADPGLGPGSMIARVYGGPLDEFVQRRDAVAKELRAAGRRPDVAADHGSRYCQS